MTRKTSVIALKLLVFNNAEVLNQIHSKIEFGL